MANKKLVMRVGALGLMGGAMALFAAQAGVLSGFELGAKGTETADAMPLAIRAAQVTPGDGTPAALAAAGAAPAPNSAAIPDAFVATQTLDLPRHSGFAAAPVVLAAAPILASGADATRPAAFNPASDLPVPGVTIAGTEPAEALSPFGLPCGLDITADPAQAATIALGVVAPCHPDSVVTITHSGMTVAVRTDAVGLANLDLPALETPAFVTVALADGNEAATRVDVPDLQDFDRVALAWTGDLGMALHVQENGAGWMTAGHVHPDAPRSAAATENGGGFLTLLGDATLLSPMLAQVYTMPRRDGPATATLSIDAPVTVGTCTQTADARVLRPRDGTGADVMPLRVTYPSCDAVGDTLVLQNVLGDVRLAAN